MLNNVSLQENILNQLQIVHKDQIFPIWVSKFVYLKVFISKRNLICYTNVYVLNI